MAGSPVQRVALRALRRAFSMKDNPVSSTSGTPSSDWGSTSISVAANMWRISSILPALPVANTILLIDIYRNEKVDIENAVCIGLFGERCLLHIHKLSDAIFRQMQHGR